MGYHECFHFLGDVKSQFAAGYTSLVCAGPTLRGELTTVIWNIRELVTAPSHVSKLCRMHVSQYTYTKT